MFRRRGRIHQGNQDNNVSNRATPPEATYKPKTVGVAAVHPRAPLPASLPTQTRDPARHAWWDAWSWYSRRFPPWATLTIPVLLATVPTILASILLPQAVPKIWAMQVIVIFALDAAVVAGIVSQLTWWLVLGVILWMEFLFLIWLLANLRVLRRVPRLNRFFAKQELKAARLYQRKRWIRRFHFLGVMVFVFLPLNSGIIAGVLVGKLTGLRDSRVIAAVYLGTILWASLLTWATVLGVHLLEPVLDNIFN